MKKNIIIAILAAISALMCNGLRAEDRPPYLDPERDVEERVKDLMGRMTLEEKVAQMCQYVGIRHLQEAEKKMSLKDLGKSDAYSFYPGMTADDVKALVEKGMIGSFLHVTTAEEANYLQGLAQKSRLRIPLLIGIDAIHGNGLVSGCTVYPSPITMSSTWCDSLVCEMSRQVAEEMRATGSHWTFAPNVDIARDPRWGRFGETAGEDPYLVGRMGAAQIKGLQNGDSEGHNNVLACAKHMIAGGDALNGSNASTSDISWRTLREIHLPPYMTAVQEAGVHTVMMAHNEINGVPCHNNRYLMQSVLRDELGFDGFIVSDWMDIERLVRHRVVPDVGQAYVESVSNGIDMHMHGPGFFDAVVKGVREGRIPVSRVDYACSRILAAKFSLGLFENPMTVPEDEARHVFTEEHRNTALELARKGVILLKNNGVLPLKKTGKIFLTGLNADNHSILGDWTFRQPEDNVVTIREGLQELCEDFSVELEYFNCGNNVSRFEIPDMSDEAVAAAEGSDLAIVAVGENPLRFMKESTCGENVDRAGLDLLNGQAELVKKLKMSGIPVIVVFVTGRPLAEEWIAENADGIVWAWEPGCMGGQAIAEILFGKVNPSGKLTASVPRHPGQLKMYYNTKPSHYQHPPIDVKTGPLYHFGYGLSYTSYEYSNLRLSDNEIAPGEKVMLSVDVTNRGNMDGDEIVQLYVSDLQSQVTRPVKELKGYRRIHLKAGETETVEFSIDTDMLAFYGLDMKRMAEKGKFRIMAGSSSRNEDLLKTVLTLTETEIK